ncbi:LysR substrate-binding domain-containing protein, partial [Castellaniella ginsengisoli]
MDLKQLEYFMRVAELGSFTQASHALNIAQPALSRQVRMLEVELRQNLLNRNGRGVTTTEAGKLLLEHCRGILHQVERAKEDMGRVQGALAGRVALGIAPSASKMMTVRLTRQFRKQLPNATLSISEGLSLVMQEWLLAGRLDIALLYNPSASADLDLSPLTSELLYLVGPRGPHPSNQPMPLRSLVHIPLVIPNRPHTVRMLLESQMALIGCKPNIRLEIDGVPAILDLVADGEGYAILTE